ncbi:MAG: hypothetical protein K0S61_3533 [Anaerocolumna sp.]|nr:hypothetical protein [Anaerocolumna sp.]
MNTLHLKYAVEVERLGSITQAADNLYMAQPNLSKAIKELEDTLGVPIFKRTSKGVVPTKKGSEFLVYAKNILSQIEKMEALTAPNMEHKQTLNISIPHGSYLANGITNFVKTLDDQKEMELNIKETGTQEAIQHILYDKFSLGIIRYEKDYESYFVNYLKDKDLSYQLIWEYDYMVVMSKNHPLASKELLTNEDFANYIELLHGDSMIPGLNLTESKPVTDPESSKKKIYLYERGSQFDLLTNINTSYMWVSPIPKELLDRYDLIQRIAPAPARKCMDILIFPKDYVFTPIENQLIDTLMEAKESLIQSLT